MRMMTKAATCWWTIGLHYCEAVDSCFLIAHMEPLVARGCGIDACTMSCCCMACCSCCFVVCDGSIQAAGDWVAAVCNS